MSTVGFVLTAITAFLLGYLLMGRLHAMDRPPPCGSKEWRLNREEIERIIREVERRAKEEAVRRKREREQRINRLQYNSRDKRTSE